ncbi:MAG: hypothetical protein AVDCRST_MAG71-2698, partial [uncultured Lysobacter sp.]
GSHPSCIACFRPVLWRRVRAAAGPDSAPRHLAAGPCKGLARAGEALDRLQHAAGRGRHPDAQPRRAGEQHLRHQHRHHHAESGDRRGLHPSLWPGPARSARRPRRRRQWQRDQRLQV